ncbi:hypothetical protein L1049_016200 [Liquidambar formosana]|uniref:Beta-glucosidase n=2 Tax=Liquidambar formosana TaxID=63359 RepID=A0AAP0RYW2_LIQFO
MKALRPKLGYSVNDFLNSIDGVRAFPIRKVKMRDLKTWQAPPAGSLKFNVDGSARGKPGLGGIGGALGDSSDSVHCLILFVVFRHETREVNSMADFLAKEGVDRLVPFLGLAVILGMTLVLILQWCTLCFFVDLAWFIHPIVYGEYPRTIQDIVGKRLPKFTEEEVKMVKGSMDFVGINQYTAYYIYDPHQEKPKVLGYQQDWNAGFALIEYLQANSYWLYNVPWGLYKAITYIKEHYGNPNVILSENGMDDPGNVTLPKGLHDTTRINFYKGYLTQLKKAIDDGANVTGYFAWSLVDNFEWRSGYTSRFGIVYVDFKTLKRYPKMSAYWFKKLLQKEKH